MDAIIFDSIPFLINEDHLLSGLKIKPGSNLAEKIKELARAAQEIAKPRAACRILPVMQIGEKHVVVGKETLSSRVMAVNFSHVPAVAAYAATCGAELDEWASSVEGMLERYCADFIMILAVAAAEEFMKNELKPHFSGNPLSSMQPGSLEDWPLPQQENLFRLLDGGAAKIGISLTESFLMRPLKSTSGIYFESDSNYSNCQLCQRENCPGRRAPFESELFEKQFALSKIPR